VAIDEPSGGTCRNAGIGLRAPHLAEVLATHPRVGWLEVHAENYMGGPALRALERVRADYPIALHGVGLSLGGADDLDRRHLERLRGLVERIEPVLVSEHLAWSAAGGAYLNHLLPLPYTEESLTVVGAHLARAQEALGRRVLLENPAAYLRFRHSPIPEPDFLNALARTTGCALLCDVNNVHVSAENLGFDALAYLDALEPSAIAEIHLAGHTVNDADGRTILIDDHGARVAPAVWRLYERLVARVGARPTLVEWDTNLPALDVLVDEAGRADRVAARALGAKARAVAS
jgi:uncharacterized protein